MHTEEAAVATDPRTPEHLSAFVPPTVERRLEEVAARNDRSLSAEVRRALVRHLDAEGELIMSASS
jgi:molybdopterin-guanine dinucleotide biosynthesis protein A